MPWPFQMAARRSNWLADNETPRAEIKGAVGGVHQVTRKMRGVGDSTSGIFGVGDGGHSSVRLLVCPPFHFPRAASALFRMDFAIKNPPDARGAAPPGGRAVCKRYAASQKITDTLGTHLAGDLRRGRVVTRPVGWRS